MTFQYERFLEKIPTGRRIERGEPRSRLSYFCSLFLPLGTTKRAAKQGRLPRQPVLDLTALTRLQVRAGWPWLEGLGCRWAGRFGGHCVVCLRLVRAKPQQPPADHCEAKASAWSEPPSACACQRLPCLPLVRYDALPALLAAPPALQSLDVTMSWLPVEFCDQPHTFNCAPLARLPVLRCLTLRGFAEPCLAGLPPSLRQLTIDGGWSRVGRYRPIAYFTLPQHSRCVLLGLTG